jgi:phosphoribosylglycinamide formyltransferase-1
MRVGVLASGTGSILEATLGDGIPVEVVVVDRPCRATEVAAAAGVPAVVVARASFGPGFDREAYTKDVVQVLTGHGVDLVAMAGFMTILDQPLFDAYEGHVLNTHPSLLPAFPGAHAVRDAIAAGAERTGTTVHVATLEVDAGPILAQEEVPILPGDTEEVLHERIKAVERRLYPTTIRQILERNSVLP